MDNFARTDIKKAAGLIRSGKTDQARLILVQLLKRDENLPAAWFLLSYTLPAGERQEYALQQALRIDPGFERARQRLAAVGGASPSVPAKFIEPPLEPLETPAPISQPEQKAAALEPGEDAVGGLPLYAEPETFAEEAQAVEERRGGRRRVMLIGILGIILIALAFLFGRQVIGSLLTAPPAAPTATEAAGFRELPPTWTASPVAASPSPEATPEGSGFEITPLDGPALALALEIQTQVAELRGLQPVAEVQNGMLSREQAAEFIERLYIGAEREQKLADHSEVLAALGLVPDGYDLLDYEISSRADDAGGFYVPEQKRVFLIGESFGELERFIYAHEFDHALVDQYYDLENFGPEEDCIVLSDACRAALSLVEGDASLLSAQWLAAYGGEDLAVALLNFAQESLSVEGETPPFVMADLAFPYAQGLAFVQSLHVDGGWEKVDGAYLDPPSTSEQVLHPEKYAAGEEAIEVIPAPVADALGADWRALEDSNLGEWLSYLILAQGASERGRLGQGEAEAAAAGWGGDRVQAFMRDNTGDAAVVVRWVGDSEAEAAEFRLALDEQLGRRFAEELGAQEGGRCWQDAGRVSCIYGSGGEILWLIGPDMGVLNLMRTAFEGPGS